MKPESFTADTLENSMRPALVRAGASDDLLAKLDSLIAQIRAELAADTDERLIREALERGYFPGMDSPKLINRQIGA